MELANIALGVMGLLLFLTALKTAKVAAALWLALTYPNFNERMCGIYESRPRTCFLVGFIDAVLTVLVILILFKVQIVAGLGLLLMLFFISVCTLAYGPAYHRMGRRLTNGADAGEVRMLLYGGLHAELIYWAPVIGQLLFLGALFQGIGAFVIATLRPRAKRAANGQD